MATIESITKRKFGQIKISACFSWPDPSLSFEFDYLDRNVEGKNRRNDGNDTGEQDGQGDE